MPKVDTITQVYFIRHAEPNYQNHNDVTRELSEHEVKASQDLVRQLAEVSIDAFIPVSINALLTPLPH